MTAPSATPWTLHNETADAYGHTLTIRSAARARVAVVTSDNWTDARLIAAAPELAAACRTLLQCEPMQRGARDGATMGMISSAIDAARAALTRALPTQPPECGPEGIDLTEELP